MLRMHASDNRSCWRVLNDIYAELWMLTEMRVDEQLCLEWYFWLGLDVTRSNRCPRFAACNSWIILGQLSVERDILREALMEHPSIQGDISGEEERRDNCWRDDTETEPGGH